jgi:hypothetical protein
VYGNSSGDATYGAGDGSISTGSGDDGYDFSDDGGDDFVQGVSQSQIENAPSVVLKAGAGAAALAANQVKNGTLSAEASAGFTTTPQPASSEAVWDSRTITWAFAPESEDGQGVAPFSGALGVQDQSVVEHAMQAWSNACN